MFEKIKFYTYEIQETEIKQISAEDEKLLRKRLSYKPEKSAGSLNPFPISTDNVGKTSARLSGTMQMFVRPPMIDNVTPHLFHLESFNIFTLKGSCYTLRKDYNSFLLLYTYEGKGTLEYQGKSYSLPPGTGFFIDCRIPHYYYSTDSIWKHSTFHFNGPSVPCLFQQYYQQNGPCFSYSFDSFYQTSIENILRTYSDGSTSREYIASDQISHLLTEMLRHGSSQNGLSKNKEQILQYLTVYMENHYAENLTLDFLSEFSGFSKYYLSREFKKYTGYSPIEYLIKMRISHAKALLTSTALPIWEIADTVGIHDINNFYQLFKKNAGVTPADFRENMQVH